MGQFRLKRSAMIAIAFIVVVLLLLSRTRQPGFQGKSLDGWLADLRWDGGSGGQHDVAVDALRHMGTNLFPVLVRELSVRDSRFKVKLMDLGSRQSLVDLPFINAETRHRRALAAFRSLGNDASGAIPHLTELFNVPESIPDAVRALVYIGPEGLSAALKAFAKAPPEARRHAVDCLGGPILTCPEVSPFMNECLRDRDNEVRRRAAMYLGFGPRDSTNTITALTGLLGDTESSVRASAAWALGNFGSSAASSLAAMTTLLKDPDSDVRRCASRAIRQIDPTLSIADKEK